MAKPSALPRELITNTLLEELKSGGIPVGDMDDPTEGVWGWQGENPDDPGDFFPYMSLSVGPADTPTGSLGDSATEYSCRYNVVYVTVRRDLTEAVADKMRLHLTGLERRSLHHDRSDTNWRIVHYQCTRIGGIQKVTSAMPDYYTQLDEFVVRVSKER